MRAGVFALVALAAHGATFLAWKTDGAVQARARLRGDLVLLLVAILGRSSRGRRRPFIPICSRCSRRRPIALATTPSRWRGLVTVGLGVRRARYLLAFIGSSAFLVGVLAATAASVFPVMLRATGGDSLSLTAYNAGAPASSLRAALGWWLVGFPIAIAYFVIPLPAARGQGGGGDRTGRILTIRNAECGMRNYSGLRNSELLHHWRSLALKRRRT